LLEKSEVIRNLNFDLSLSSVYGYGARLGANHPWVKGIQVCSNEGDFSSPRGDNSRRIKKHRTFLKSTSPEPASQIQSNLVQIILG
jgi:hypothetical protein